MQETLQEPFSQEEKRLVGELVELVSDAYSRIYIPFLVFDGKKVKEDLTRAKNILERLV